MPSYRNPKTWQITFSYLLQLLEMSLFKNFKILKSPMTFKNKTMSGPHKLSRFITPASCLKKKFASSKSSTSVVHKVCAVVKGRKTSNAPVSLCQRVTLLVERKISIQVCETKI